MTRQVVAGQQRARQHQGGDFALGEGHFDVFEQRFAHFVVIDDQHQVAVGILLGGHARVDGAERFVGEGVVHHLDIVEIDDEDAARR
jgi:hypothetical protein